MLQTGDATEIAARFSLGDAATLSGPVARGEVGQVWRLTTSRGTFAVKEPFEPISLDEVREHADYQEAAHAAGIPVPAVFRAGDGDAFAELAGVQVRVFEWVDLLERDADVDPAQVGRIVASIHRLEYRGRLPTDPWYTDAIGSERWDALLDALHTNGAPFAERLSEMRDELVALEGGTDGGAARARDMPSRPLGRQRPAHAVGRLVRHRLGELRPRGSEPGSGTRLVRVRSG
jgi:hypothetical protein